MAVRLASLELNNFKNVKHGKIKMPSQLNSREDREDADIVGIYGQNGSGKTAVIDSLYLAKQLLSGCPLPLHTRDYITKDEQEASIILNFCVDFNESCYGVEYGVKFANEDNVITCEYAKITELLNGTKKLTDSIYIDNSADSFLKPKKLMITHIFSKRILS